MASLEPSQEQLDLALNAIEERIAPTRERVAEYKLDVLSLVESSMPAVGRDALSVGRQFAAGQVPESVVREALERCWAYANERWPDGGLASAEACAIRSVISLLHGLMYDDDFVEAVSFFHSLINRIEPHYSEEVDLLQRHFGSSEDLVG